MTPVEISRPMYLSHLYISINSLTISISDSICHLKEMLQDTQSYFTLQLHFS